MNPSDIPYLSATELGGLIRAKEVTPLEAVDAYLARIEEVDTRLNSYITVCGDEAREEAKSIGEEIARGESRGPLHGVPVGIKDQIYVKGVRNSDGSKIRNDFVPEFDATVVALAEQGFAIIDAEKDEGIINTDYRAEGALFSFFSGGPTRLKVSALVSNADNGTHVLLNFDLQDANQSVESGNLYNARTMSPRRARRYYQEFFGAIEDRLFM